MKASAGEVDALFQSFDVDNSGSLSLKELSRHLRRSAAGDITLSEEMRAGAVQYTLTAKNAKSEARNAAVARSRSAQMVRQKVRGDLSHIGSMFADGDGEEDAKKGKGKGKKEEGGGSKRESVKPRGSIAGDKAADKAADRAGKGGNKGGESPQSTKRASVTAKEGGRYYPNAADRSVPDWGGGSTPAASFTDRSSKKAGKGKGEGAEDDVVKPPNAAPATLPTAIDAEFRDKMWHYEMLQAPTTPLCFVWRTTDRQMCNDPNSTWCNDPNSTWQGSQFHVV